MSRPWYGFGVIVEQISKKAMSYPASIADRLAEAHNGFSKQRSFLFRTLWIMRVLAWGTIVAGLALLAWKYHPGFGAWVGFSDRKSTRLKSSPYCESRMPSSACKQ